MKRIFEWIGGFILILFSFYFTDKVSLLVASKSDLMNEIKSVAAEYNTNAISAQINVDDNTIIPGFYGKKVSEEESYLNMHDFGSFNDNYFVFDYIKPDVSLSDNKDKYIISGLPSKRQVSLVLEQNTELENYLTSSNIKYDVIAVNDMELKDDIEYLNGESDAEDFNKLDTKISHNQKICIYDYSNNTSCNKKKYFTIKPQINLQNSNVAQVKNSITTGSIILISASSKIENLKLVLNEIKFKDLKIVYISELIKEKE